MSRIIASADSTVKIKSTDVVIKKGYSPYVDDDGIWWEYSDTEKGFVNTGIPAKGGSYDDTEIKNDLVELQNSDKTATSGYVWTATEDGAEWAEAQGKEESDLDMVADAIDAGLFSDVLSDENYIYTVTNEQEVNLL